MLRRNFALLALLALAPAAKGSVYKCLLDDGRVFYQDTPCAPGRELRDFDKDPANVSVMPFTQPARPARPPAKATRPKSERTTAKDAKAARAGDPAERKFLRPGMSEGEVLARIGPPDMTSSKNRKGQRWTYMPDPADPRTITNLQFENGRLSEIERKVIR
jgi:hypothetical protein